jgi:hypothetical protein
MIGLKLHQVVTLLPVFLKKILIFFSENNICLFSPFKISAAQYLQLKMSRFCQQSQGLALTRQSVIDPSVYSEPLVIKKEVKRIQPLPLSGLLI